MIESKPDEIVDLTGRLCLVTGATTGHGMAVAAALGRMGAAVVLGSRSLERGEAACARLRAQIGLDRFSVLPLDLASQQSVRAAADRFLSAHPILDVLINNAGAWWADRRASPDGIELVWATNVVGPYLLTQRLLPALRASGGGRIVNVASTQAGGLDLDDVEFTRRPYNGLRAYQACKQAVRMMTWTTADQLQGQPVVANALCPGFMKTELGRNAPPGFRVFLWLARPFQASPERGADTAVWLASSPETGKASNQFFVKRRPRVCRFRDQVARQRLQRLCDAAVAPGRSAPA